MFDFGGFNPKFPLLKGHWWAPKGPSPQWSSNATQITSPWPESVQGSFRVARSASEKISLPVTLVTLQGTIGSMDWFTAFSRGIPWFLPPRILANFTLDQCLAWSEWRQRMAFWEYNFCVKQYLVDHTNLLSCILHKLAKRQQDSLALDRWNWGSWQLLALGQSAAMNAKQQRISSLMIAYAVISSKFGNPQNQNSSCQGRNREGLGRFPI